MGAAVTTYPKWDDDLPPGPYPRLVPEHALQYRFFVTDQTDDDLGVLSYCEKVTPEGAIVAPLGFLADGLPSATPTYGRPFPDAFNPNLRIIPAGESVLVHEFVRSADAERARRLHRWSQIGMRKIQNDPTHIAAMHAAEVMQGRLTRAVDDIREILKDENALDEDALGYYGPDAGYELCAPNTVVLSVDAVEAVVAALKRAREPR